MVHLKPQQLHLQSRTTPKTQSNSSPQRSPQPQPQPPHPTPPYTAPLNQPACPPYQPQRKLQQGSQSHRHNQKFKNQNVQRTSTRRPRQRTRHQLRRQALRLRRRSLGQFLLLACRHRGPDMDRHRRGTKDRMDKNRAFPRHRRLERLLRRVALLRARLLRLQTQTLTRVSSLLRRPVAMGMVMLLNSNSICSTNKPQIQQQHPTTLSTLDTLQTHTNLPTPYRTIT